MPSASDPRQPARVSPRRVLSRQASVRCSRRRVRLSLLHVRRSPPRMRPAQPSERISSQLLVRRSPVAALVLSSRLLRNAHRSLNRCLMRIPLMARTAWLPRRVRATTRMLAVARKRKAPRCP